MHIVVANELHSRNSRITLVAEHGELAVVKTGDEPLETALIAHITDAHEKFLKKEEIKFE